MHKITRCNKCLMPDTKPGLVLNEDGVCQACVRHEARKDIDWVARENKLRQILGNAAACQDKTDYNCIIPVSGGKDSYYQIDIIKNLWGMNPLLVSVIDSFTHTKEGVHNFNNMLKVFNCDHIQIKLSPQTEAKMMRIAFEELGSPTWPIDRAIYYAPLKLAAKLGIPLVIYGENVSWEYGGVLQEETYDASDQILNDVAKDVDTALFINHGIKLEEMNQHFLTQDEIDATKPIYLSYFYPWSGWDNFHTALQFGFKSLSSWSRVGYIDTYDQIDSVGYLFNVWMKWPKYCFGRVTDVCGYWLRDGIIDKPWAEAMIKAMDHKLDKYILKDFMRVTGYKIDEMKAIIAKHITRYENE